MFELVTESPAWLSFLCVLAGALMAFLLYRREQGNNGVRTWLLWLMISLRFVAVTLLAFLLLTPLIKTLTRQTEKPIILIAQDNSESIVTNKDSAFYKLKYASDMMELSSGLADKYEIKELSFGDKVSEGLDFSYSGKQTDFTRLFEEVEVRYANRNVGALILASDGLYNSGSNPVYNHPGFPVYSVALGDTTAQKDLLAGSIQYNKIAYLNNSFPMEIAVIGRELSGTTTTLTVQEDSAVLFTRQIEISGNKFRQVIPVYLDAKKKGIHHYKIGLSPVTGEITATNNQKDIYIEVQEAKRKVLIVVRSPHPDIGAIRQAIESNENYEVTVATADKTPATVKDYQLVILHQLPALDQPATALLASLKEANVPVLYVLGAQTNIVAFNQLDAGITVRNILPRGNEVKPSLNQAFGLFTLDPGLEQAVRGFSPLMAPFGEYLITAPGSALLYQQVGSLVTSQPLLFLGESGTTKTGVLCGEGCWRWRLQDYQVNQNFNVFNSLFSKTVQYLSIREVRTRFRVLSKNSFNENEPVVMDAEVYNDNFELINTPDVSITVINRAGRSFPFTFSKTDRVYTLNAGIFAPGDYHYKAQVKVGEKVFTDEGDFSVQALQVELNETVADHQLLNSLSVKTGGQLFYPSQLKELSSRLQARGDIKTVSYSQVKLVDLVNLKAIFFLLLALLSIEWFLRKRSGGY